MFDQAVIVAAHPDDEVLWFSSVLGRVDRVILCFEEVESKPEWTEGRRRSLASYPLENVATVGLRESEVFWGVDWNAIRETDFGVEITDDRFSDATYRRNYELLVEALSERLVGARNVITHNPWGEYGHVEHIQVFRAVRSLQPRMGFDLWFSNYCSNRTAALMARWTKAVGGERVSFATDAALAKRVAALYKSNGCWTWYPDYAWCDTETFFRYPGGPESEPAPGVVFPINLVAVEPADGRWTTRQRPESMWRRLIGAARRRMAGTGRGTS